MSNNLPDPKGLLVAGVSPALVESLSRLRRHINALSESLPSLKKGSGDTNSRKPDQLEVTGSS